MRQEHIDPHTMVRTGSHYVIYISSQRIYYTKNVSLMLLLNLLKKIT